VAKIRVLPDSVARKIAAGEVIERPASVVKELVENSLDAAARRIVVEIAQGGRSRIAVTDDGEGIAREDAVIAFQPHATSKIRHDEDLRNISTLGFRGEALPSIAAVADVELWTCRRESDRDRRATPPGNRSWSGRRRPGCRIEVPDLSATSA
jgi:DNA mismatch repair protein MutL